MANRQKLSQRVLSLDKGQFWHRVQDKSESLAVVKLCCLDKGGGLNGPVRERVLKDHGKVRGCAGVVLRNCILEELRGGQCARIVNYGAMSALRACNCRRIGRGYQGRWMKSPARSYTTCATKSGLEQGSAASSLCRPVRYLCRNRRYSYRCSPPLVRRSREQLVQ
jgi:hypothetical protein